MLASGPVAVAKLESEAKDAALKWRTVQRAADELAVVRDKGDFNGGWTWALPTPEAQDAKSAGQAP